MSNIPLGATILTDLARNSILNVESLNAFPAPISEVITIEDLKKYIPTKLINFLKNQFKIPDNGQTVIEANNQLVNNFQSSITDGRAFIIGDINRVILRDLVIESTTGSGACFDIETITAPVAIISLLQSRIQGFSAIGTVENSLFQTDGVAFILCDDGISLIDNDVIEIMSTNFIAQSGNHISVSGTVGAFRASNITAVPSTGDAVFDFDSELTLTSALITNCSFNDVNGGTFFSTTGLDQTDPRIVALNNSKAIDSYWVGVMGFLDNAIDTVIVTVNTYTDIAGVILAGVDNERFTLLNGVLTYIGLESKKFIISLNMSLKKALGASARTVRGALFIDTGLGFVEGSSAPLDMDNDIKSFGFSGVHILNTGDKLKIQIKNETNNDDILIVTYDFVVNQA